MIKYIVCEDFYSYGEIKSITSAVNTLEWIDAEYGNEIEGFRICPKGIEETFSKFLGNRRCHVDTSVSGVFRKPHNCMIHFESFSSPLDWCFYLAIEPTTFNFHKHVKTGATSALQETNLDYSYIPSWDYTSNILLDKNQGIFFRPWLFHSLENGITLNYRLSVES
jgi:hypothetical protein